MHCKFYNLKYKMFIHYTCVSWQIGFNQFPYFEIPTSISSINLSPSNLITQEKENVKSSQRMNNAPEGEKRGGGAETQ